MSRALTAATTLESLKKEAKRWLKALRAHDEPAHARLRSAFPNAPAAPGLRDVQHALALEHGFAGWTALKQALALRHAQDGSSQDAEGSSAPADLEAWFLENACPDHHVRGGPAHSMALHTAERILTRYPDVARSSLYTAIVCGDLDEVTRILTERPQAAVEKSGPKGWEPLLYLCFTRLRIAAARDNAVAIARALLDQGADPNVYFMAGNSHYTPLVGVIGEGEEDRPPHSQRAALAQLLLERGADPFDIQVIYNTHFHGDVLWFLELIHAHSTRSGRQAAWDDPDWSMLDMGGYGCGARFLLHQAVKNNDIRLAEWMLTHGASPNALPPPVKSLSQRSLHDEALRTGSGEMGDLLRRFGATPGVLALTDDEVFQAACLRLDREEVRVLLERHPEYLQSTDAMFAAARLDRADVVAFLLDLGVPIEIEDRHKNRPLHTAAANGALRVAALLIERGAEIDPIETNWDNTPLDFAVYHQQPRMIELLSRVSRDLWSLTFTGQVERLRELLSVQPELARVVNGNGSTLLMWLPDDDARALEIARLLLAHGVDPSIKNQEGKIAADLADKRGLFAVAEVLRAASSAPERLDLKRYERAPDSGAERRRRDD
jgi:ankyrin repeat protein